MRVAVLLALARARKQSRTRASRLPCTKILVLCYGNIYRSPLVAEVLRHSLSQREEFEVQSAGFHVKANRPSPPPYVAHLKELAVADLTQHRSRLVTTTDVEWADLVIIMDRHNWHALAKLVPRSLAKVVWLGAFCDGTSIEIPDPFGRPEEQVGAIIRSMLEGAGGLAAHLSATEAAARLNEGMEILE